MREDSPGHGAATRARNALEEALFALSALPLDFDREGVRDRLMHAVELAYTALDSGPLARAHLDALSEASALAGEARSILAAAGDRMRVPSLGATLDQLASAESAFRGGHDAVAQIQLARRAELYGAEQDRAPSIRPFRASVGLPELHAFTRRSLLPRVDVARAEPAREPPLARPTILRPRTLAELATFQRDAAEGALARRLLAPEVEPPAAVAAGPLPLPYEPATEEVEVLRRLARSYLEDIAGARSQRTPNAIETWLDQARFEQRLLDNLDAFASLGGAVLPLVSIFHAEAKAPDPGRAFAVALTLGCIEGNDTIGAALLTLKQSAPEEHPGWLDGFRLAPAPAIDVAMADLCTCTRPELVALALDVLHARGRTPDEVVVALLDRTESEILTRVARALATALPRQDAIAHLGRICATTEDDDLFLAAVEALLRRGHGRALTLLRDVIAAPPSPAWRRRALPLLCLMGRASDIDRLVAAANEAPSVPLLRGLGRFGHAESLGTLQNLLEDEDADIVAAAAEALDRITGAGLREIVEEPWEVELPPEAAEAGGIPVPMRKVERVVTDPAQWAAWVQGNARRFDAKVKTRGGVPFMPMQIVAELEAKATTPHRRAEAALELSVVTGIASTFSPHDWVARQKEHLAELRGQVGKLGATPGTWPMPAGFDPVAPRPRPAAIDIRTDSPAPEALPPAPFQPAMSPRWAEPPMTEAVEHDGHDATSTVSLSPAFVASLALPFEQGVAPPAGPARPAMTEAVEHDGHDATSTVSLSPAFVASLALPFEQGGSRSAEPPVEDDEESRMTLPVPLPAQSGLPSQPAHGLVMAADTTGAEAVAEASPLPSWPLQMTKLEDAAPTSESPVTAPLPPVVIERPASPFIPGQVSWELEAALGADGCETVSLPPLVVSKAALPFQASQPAGGSGTSAAPQQGPGGLSLEQYAALCAELAIFPQHVEATFQRYGLGGLQARLTADLGWQERLRRNTLEYQDWQARYRTYLAYWSERARAQERATKE